MPDREHDIDTGEEAPSKTALKREMHARQALGETLAGLAEKQLAALPIGDERLLAAIRETRNIRSKNARRRHLQFIGKLMRDVDPAPIEAALETQRRPDREATARFHALESLRDQVLSEGVGGVETVLQRWPAADRQQLRQLLLQHQREQRDNKPPAASRKLFRYLRDLQEDYGGDS